MTQRRESEGHTILRKLAADPATPEKLRVQAAKGLAALELMAAKLQLIRERRAAAREKAAKEDSKDYGI